MRCFRLHSARSERPWPRAVPIRRSGCGMLPTCTSEGLVAFALGLNDGWSSVVVSHPCESPQRLARMGHGAFLQFLYFTETLGTTDKPGRSCLLGSSLARSVKSMRTGTRWTTL